MKPKLRPPKSKRLKLEYDGLLSNFTIKFSLRRFSVVTGDGEVLMVRWCSLP